LGDLTTRPDQVRSAEEHTSADDAANPPARWSRRRLLGWGLGSAIGVIAAAGAGVELVSHGVLPGKDELDRLDGACSATGPPLRFSTPGSMHLGTFFSKARRREVRYTIAYPPGHGPGSQLPLVVVLHAYGATSANALSGITLGDACALNGLPPMALVAADGGNGYWNPHPGDDPMGMVADELIPLCQSRGLGRPPQRIGTIGISMGGYGALLLGETRPRLISAVAAISPAIWTTYTQARSANDGAYASARDFARYDVITHASALAGKPVRVSSGTDDPFHPGVEALAQALPRHAIVDFSGGCHTGSFFQAQEEPSLAFLGTHLVS
jgi:enterochelin esterase-like enzyme